MLVSSECSRMFSTSVLFQTDHFGLTVLNLRMAILPDSVLRLLSHRDSEELMFVPFKIESTCCKIAKRKALRH